MAMLWQSATAAGVERKLLSKERKSWISSATLAVILVIVCFSSDALCAKPFLHADLGLALEGIVKRLNTTVIDDSKNGERH